MPNDEAQRAVFDFFVARLRDQAPFTKEDVRQVAGWSQSSLNTYWSKQFRPLVVEGPSGSLRVSEAFRRFKKWELFQRHVTQVRPAAADYAQAGFDDLVVYEFFMPLANEEPLRITLDALFYRDTIEAKLRAADLNEVRAKLNLPNSTDDELITRATEWVENHVVGYSIYHVDGRFRGEKLMTYEEAAALQADGDRYLIDETTAVTRFIFPCSDEAEADLVRFFFHLLFVRSIIQLVNAEDEIWMVESGSRNRVHVWRVDD